MGPDASSTIKQQLRDLLPYLIRFIRHPVEGIKNTPRMSWPAIFSIQLGGAMLSGALLGILNMNFWDFLIGLFIFPITSLVTSIVFSLFLTYFFSLFRSTYLEFRRLYAIVVLANLPYFIFHTVSGFLPPIDLIGFALTAILLIVGIVEQFSLDRKTVVRLVSVLYLVFAILWMAAQIRSVGGADEKNRIPEPRALDELEREMRG